MATGTGKAAESAKKAGQQATQKAAEAAPTDQLKSALGALAGSLASRASSAVTDKVSASAKRLSDYAESGGAGGLSTALSGAGKVAEGESPAKAAASTGVKKIGEKVKNAAKKLTGGGGGGGGLKLTNIVESIDIGAPLDLVYDQWTQFTDFPDFMKKVENVEQESDEKLSWKAQILWSHRTWDATITDQVPDERIVWRSEGPKGYVDGAVTFHELAPRLTRVLVVLEYHPQGFFEYTGNLWRAQGRRVRLELKHFRRHMMTSALLHPDEIKGWHGRIEDGEVVDEGDTDSREGGGESEGDESESGESEGESESGEDESGESQSAGSEDEDSGSAESGDGEEPPPTRSRQRTRQGGGRS
ncbi:SRPBCC family protein [Saccharomonospora saliphila]|uniref:SRPBCC family protein n=1 Tax=Saccharomonospora saliphila TaxID=369829 RepID=UPI000360A7EC|nr:SRPBCC family protein [Saccharomonospora saliphila]